MWNNIGLSMYSDIKGISSTDNQETINTLLFESTMKYYKDKLGVSIVVPRLPLNKGVISSFFKAVKTRVYDSFKGEYKIDILNDIDGIKYFGDFITTDALDSVITEIPIEVQLLKEETCSELGGINSRILDELKEFIKMDDELGDTSKKREIKKELEEKIKSQEEILSVVKSKNIV